jgi:ABC-type glycerol-3-phosphate transport system substrate-binding protein
MEVTMKKILIVLAIVLTATILISCKDDKPKDDRTVITYASWNLGSPETEDTNMERLMIKAFMEKYPDIRVDIIERPKVPGTTGDMAWNDFLAARASTQTLPDVFQSDNIPAYVINNWAYNISDVALDDSEYLNISEDIRGVATYDGKVMGIPNAVFYAGYIVNKSLYEYQGQTAPTLTTTWDDFITVTKAAADHTSTTNQGVVGLEGIEHIIHWYPSQVNEDLGWFTLDNDGFNLDSAAFGEAISEYRALRTDPSFVWEALLEAAGVEDSGIDISVMFPEPVGDYFNNGAILAKWFYSWDFGWIQTNIAEGDYTWDLDFIGVPVVNGNKRIPIVADFFTLASNTDHPQEAYLLAKWMGFGKEGYLKRIELSNTVEGISKVNFVPIQDDEQLLDEYFELYPGLPGLRTIIETGSFIVEPPKYLPGYVDARYQGTYDAENKMGDIINKLLSGEVQYADIRTPLNTKANDLFSQAKAAFDAALATK